MEPVGIVITTLTLIVVPMNMFAHWSISKGKLKIAYPILMIVYALYITIETILAFNVPSQISILLFNVVNMWAFYMAFRGMKRLKKEKELQKK